MCAYSFGIGGQDDIVNEGCLLYMPPEDFYRATAKAAIKYWNDFAQGLVNLRLRNEKKMAKKNENICKYPIGTKVVRFFATLLVR
jgi:hypothetical protein